MRSSTSPEGASQTLGLWALWDLGAGLGAQRKLLGLQDKAAIQGP